MTTVNQIRKAIIAEIEDLDMAAALRDCSEVVDKQTGIAAQRMEDHDEPAALRALCNGVWALAQADPWQPKKEN